MKNDKNREQPKGMYPLSRLVDVPLSDVHVHPLDVHVHLLVVLLSDVPFLDGLQPLLLKGKDRKRKEIETSVRPQESIGNVSKRQYPRGKLLIEKIERERKMAVCQKK